MRLWPPWRRRPSASTSEPSFLTEDYLTEAVREVLAVRQRQVVGGAVVYRGPLLVPITEAVDRLVTRMRPVGYTPFFHREGEDVVLQALPLAEAEGSARVLPNVVLFVLTCATTLLAGTGFAGSPTFDAFRETAGLGFVLSGVPFAATLLAILGVHEFGHYFTARHYQAAVSLPYFIPAPPPVFLFGTLGAIIRMKSIVRDRNALFDIAAAGPLAGLAVAIPAMVVGLHWSHVVPETSSMLVFGDSLLRRLFVLVQFGSIPAGMMLYTHPIADAAWTGFLVTALNLLPVGQLDGGRIAYALFGRRHRTVGLAAFGLLLLLGLATGALNWFVWAGLIFFLVGFHHSPPLDDVTPLTWRRRALGVLCLVLLVLLMPPVPLTID